MRDEMPQEIQSLIAQCEANVASFDNDQMSAALHWGETMYSHYRRLEIERDNLRDMMHRIDKVLFVQRNQRQPQECREGWIGRIIGDLERRLEACRRYFEHTERVSVSSQHAACDSSLMDVRMALKREAKEACYAED